MDIYPQKGHMSHMLDMFLIFKGNLILFSYGYNDCNSIINEYIFFSRLKEMTQ